MVLRETCAQGQVMNFKGHDKATKHFDAGDVSNIMISKGDASTIYIKASCLASMKKLKYTVYICMALSGDKHTSQLAQTCSHVGALLFALNKTGRERGNESVAPTDVLCQWKVPRNMTLKPVPVSDLNLSGARSAVDEDDRPIRQSINFDPRSTNSREFDVEYATRNLSGLKTIFPKTGMAHLWNIVDQTPPVADEQEVQTQDYLLFEKMNALVFTGDNIPDLIVDDEVIRYVEKYTTKQRECQLWRDLHKARITSSVFGEILHAGDAHLSLITKIMEGPSNDRHSSLPQPIAWGVSNEDRARRDFERCFNLEVLPTGLTLSSVYSFLGASSDGRVIDKNLPTDRNTGVLELKCPYSINGVVVNNKTARELLSHHDFYMSRIDGVPHLNRKHKYYAQIQGEMAIIGLPWCDFVVWTSANGDNIIHERIYFDTDFVSDMMPKLVNFYMKHIYPKIMK